MTLTGRLRTREDLLGAGWTEYGDDGFVGYVGPFWRRHEADTLTLGFLADNRHKNLAGLVQGGMLATLADRTLGLAAGTFQPNPVIATIQLDIHYIGAAKLGEFVTTTARLMQHTRALAFMSGRLEADGRLVGNATGVWRIRSARTEDGST